MTVPPQPLTLAAETGAGGILLWVVLPYVSLAIFVLGHVWRYRTSFAVLRPSGRG
ncbi:hypothetical protein GCM10010269_50070 [Streptomyces humidus]|uniref:NarG-like domain-containing protein n=1 Tax=Streptomyces humidus TaxID=52259 RepID=A0A918L5B1_9ACTN|nr:respiratory nitrate reductase subunit gamma [Streptomyces humidus]GGS05220.1 hypothetical protein GCM10010269_50070 [Streptomyces humidus]